ncbi:MAG TPA: alpha/beta fold hydrolase, partial [Streptosporangiaceae bacterium]|nr:alpha/beta fold hydrolase [Streptosporangiaceae bacterium]
DAGLEGWFTPGFREANSDLMAQMRAMLVATPPEGYAGCCEAIAAMDLRPVLGSITAPTLVIAGAEDPSTPPWQGALLAGAIPGATLTVVRGAAHLASYQTPGPVTAALAAHLAPLLV